MIRKDMRVVVLGMIEILLLYGTAVNMVIPTINSQMAEDLKKEMDKTCYEYVYVPIYRLTEGLYVWPVTNMMFAGSEFRENGYSALLSLISRLDPNFDVGLENETLGQERVSVLALYFLYLNYSVSEFEKHYEGVTKALNIVGNFSGLVRWDPQKVDVLVALCEDLSENLVLKYPYWVLSAADVFPYYFYYMGKTSTSDIPSSCESMINWYILTTGSGADNLFNERSWAIEHIKTLLTDVENGRYFDPESAYSLRDPIEIMYLERALLLNPSLAEFYQTWNTVYHPNSVNERVWGHYFSNTTINVLNVQENWNQQDHTYRAILRGMFDERSLNASFSELLTNPWKAGSIVLGESAPEAIREIVKIAWQYGRKIDKATLCTGIKFHDYIHVNGTCYPTAFAASIFWQSIGLPLHRASARYSNVAVGHTDIAIYMSEEFEKALKSSNHELLNHPLVNDHLIALDYPSEETCATDLVSAAYIYSYDYGTETWTEIYPPKVTFPVAAYSNNPKVPSVNESILFNASSSGYSITTYQWDFGDDNVTTVTEPIITHAYSSTGNYTVTLNVTDNNGMWNSTTKIITVTLVTDLDRNRIVNILDITTVATVYGSHGPNIPNIGDPPSEQWNPLADLDKNGTVNILDISAIAKDYGKTV